MDKLSLQGFYDFVAAQPADRKVYNVGGWCTCAIGDYIKATTSKNVDEGLQSGAFETRWAQNNLPGELHARLNSRFDGPLTYGELSKVVSEFAKKPKMRLDQAIRNLSAMKHGIDEWKENLPEYQDFLEARPLIDEIRDAITDVLDSWEN